MRRRFCLQALTAAIGCPAGVAAADRLAALSFPRDFGAHSDVALEWWYLTGLLGVEATAPTHGYQLTCFRIRGPAAPNHPSALAPRQLMLGHIALSDLRAGRLLHEQRLYRALPGLAGASEADTDAAVGDWRLTRHAQGYRAHFASSPFTPAAGGGFALDLQLTPTQPVLLQGEQGLSRKGPAPQQHSRYYSQVQLRTQAVLQVAGRAQALQGKSWLDHEWSNDLLGVRSADGQAKAVGWDWLGINLHSGAALTVFRLRRSDGSVLWAGGSWREPGQPMRNFAPAEVQMLPTRFWKSAQTAARYPVQWQLQTPLGALSLEAYFDAQEIDARLSSGMAYWEGAARLRDGQGVEVGAGYLELTGYAGPLRLA